ncbi:hypothetical protein GGI12_002851 [Dipsacomyces acuminosporus]|nr:hypothetical protein GGI12_002851 [Dipsacomyces acuminosporus]
MSNPYIGKIEVLHSMPDSSTAMGILHRIAAEVRYVMEKYGWRVGKLSEFDPEDKTLVGLNVSNGVEIRLRLRYPYNPSRFLPYDDIKGVMHHELVHIMYDRHDSDFFRLLDHLNSEAGMPQGSGYGEVRDADIATESPSVEVCPSTPVYTSPPVTVSYPRTSDCPSSSRSSNGPTRGHFASSDYSCCPSSHSSSSYTPSYSYGGSCCGPSNSYHGSCSGSSTSYSDSCCGPSSAYSGSCSSPASSYSGSCCGPTTSYIQPAVVCPSSGCYSPPDTLCSSNTISFSGSGGEGYYAASGGWRIVG